MHFFAGKCSGEGDCYEDASFPNGFRCECYSGYIGEQCSPSLDGALDELNVQPLGTDILGARSPSFLPPGASEDLDVDAGNALEGDNSFDVNFSNEPIVQEESGVYFNSVSVK